MKKSLTLIILLAVMLRMAMIATQKSLWGDEWWSLELVLNPSGWEVLKGAIRDVHPPFYFMALWGWLKIAGQSEWALRFLSAAAGVVVVWATAFVTKELIGKREALLAAFLIAISPYWLQSANELRTYSLVACWTSLATYFYTLRQQHRQNPLMVFLFAATALAAIYTEHYAWFWLAAIGVYALMQNKSEWKLGAIIALLSLPSLALIAYQAKHTEYALDASRLDDYFHTYINLPMMFKKAVGVFWHISCGYYYSMIPVQTALQSLRTEPLFLLSLLATGCAVLLAARGFLCLLRRSRSKALFVFLMFIFPIIFLMFFYSIRLHARYLSFCSWAFFILIAIGYFDWPRKNIKNLLLGVVLMVMTIGTAHALILKTDTVHRDDYPAILNFLVQKTGPNDAICNLEFQMKYLANRDHVKIRTDYFKRWEEWALSNTSKYEKVYLLECRNMLPEITERLYREKRDKMLPYGYTPAAEPIIFGGKNGLLYVYIFKNEGRKTS